MNELVEYTYLSPWGEHNEHQLSWYETEIFRAPLCMVVQNQSNRPMPRGDSWTLLSARWEAGACLSCNPAGTIYNIIIIALETWQWVATYANEIILTCSLTSKYKPLF